MFDMSVVVHAASVLALFGSAARAFNAHDRPCPYAPGTPVNTSSGLVYGHPAPNATDVSEYLGIPFAQPPVGELRFAPPVPYKSDAVISGQKAGHVCAQAQEVIPTSLPLTEYNLYSVLADAGQDPKEDCLTVNVWSKPQSGERLKPVMVWIYGGAFTEGGTNGSVYSGQYWADGEDVVFVNFNYRLSIFGFPGSPATTQNVAFLDQRLAVEWVRENIRGFGGDPHRITIFGESAGAASVDYYSYAWLEDPIIAGTITQSGQATAFGNRGADQQAAAWYTASEKLGCGTNKTRSALAVLECMRRPNITQADLIAASLGGGGIAAILGNFGPTIDNKTVFSNYTDRAVNKQVIQVPALVGSNDYEGGLFAGLFGGGDSLAVYITQVAFTCPANLAAYYRTLSDLPIYRYRYFGMFPNLEISGSIGRAYHGSEILPEFGTSESVTQQDSTWQERLVGGYVRSAWATFAHYPSDGLARVYGWPQYSADPNVTGLVLIAPNNSTGVEFVPRGQYDTGC